MKLLFLLLVVPLVSSDRIVTSNSGPIRGTTVPGKKVEAFLGIPYAEPPVGELRFAKPVPKSPWEQAYDAKELPPSCVQGNIDLSIPAELQVKMSEDCLFLNLWVPEGGSDKKPIMVWIHGGGFMFGSSNIPAYNGATLSEYGDVIVASINFRVGTLGFFIGLTDGAQGNMAMYDQVMAIQWIKDNARHFGGDPDNIVLFGESAGSMSVSLHLISPLSKNLFKRAILMSGSGINPVYTEDNKIALTGSQLSASLSGCVNDGQSLKENSKAIVDCMKQLPAEKFTEIDTAIFKKVGFLLIIPRVGDEFLPRSPLELYKSHEFKEDEILIGVTRDEGSLLAALQNLEIFGISGEKVNPSTFNQTLAKQVIDARVVVEDRDFLQSYLDRVKDGFIYIYRYTYLDVVKDVVGDFLITCGVVFQSEYQSQKDVPVYFYLFNYRPPSSFLAEWMGVAHHDDVPYLFGNPLVKPFTEFEKEFSRNMMDMFLAFTKTGNPNIPGGTKWPLYTSKDPRFYMFDKKDGLGVRPDNNRCEVWRKVFGAE